MDTNIKKTLKHISLSSHKCCFLCSKFIENQKILIMYNILPRARKCFSCYNSKCDCTLYLYGHEECLKKFEKKNFNSKIKKYVIKDFSEYFISGLSI